MHLPESFDLLHNDTVIEDLSVTLGSLGAVEGTVLTAKVKENDDDDEMLDEEELEDLFGEDDISDSDY